MRRRLRLRVLYWPILASAAIVALLCCSGPLEPHLVPWRVNDPLGVNFWAGSDIATETYKVYAIAGSSDRPGHETGGEISASGRHRSGRPLRTLLTDRGAMSSVLLGPSPLPRPETGGADRWGDAPDRRIAARAAMLTGAPLATAELRAPQRRMDEELAGLDFESVSHEPSSLRFVSSGHVSAHDTAVPWQSGHHAYVGDEVGEASSDVSVINRSRHGLGGSWPETPQLSEDLRQVAVLARPHRGAAMLATLSSGTADAIDFQDWQRQVHDQLDQLRQLPSIASPESAAMLGRLSVLADRGYQAAESVVDRPRQITCLCAAQALLRRVAVWTAAHRATLAASAWVGDDDTAWAGRELIDRLIQQVGADMAQTADAKGWSGYLLLDELGQANRSEHEPQRRIVAQRFLSRLTWYGLSEPQRSWMQRESVDALKVAVRRWAVAPVDYASLLGQLERQESDAIDLGAIDVARAVQSLRFATSPEAAQLAAAINTHYRNANIRLAITDTLINRLIPEVDARVEPVRQRVLGADVRGQSHVDSQLAVRLLPSTSTWRLQLETTGHVRADTASRSGPVSIRTGSHAEFISTTPLEFTRLSVTSGGTEVSVDSNTRLRGVETDFDSLPLIGSLVREIAMSRYQSLAPQAKQIQHGQIRSGVSAEVDQRVAEQLNDASGALSRHLVGPLGSLGLSPMVVDMQTTPQRLTARYRIGGDWQLAAFTPRPRAPADSLMSVQVHQSALNNTLETVLPAGQTKTIHEITSQLKELFAVQAGTMADDEDHDELGGDALIHFASTRPITIEIEDDILWVTLRVMRLSRSDSLDLRRFIVRAGYRCETDGLDARLVRDGHLRISGPGMSMRDRLPVRAIFNKVFSTRRPLSLTPTRMTQHPAMQGLVVTQLELRDGWLGMAIGPDAQPRVASNALLPP